MQITYKGRVHTLRKNEAIRFLNEERMALVHRVITTQRTYYVACGYHNSSGLQGKYTSKMMKIDAWWSEVLWQKGDAKKKKQYIVEQISIIRSCFPELPDGVNREGRLEFTEQEIFESGILEDNKD